MKDPFDEIVEQQPASPEEANLVRSALKITQDYVGTYVFVAAVSNVSRNKMLEIPCRNAGRPINAMSNVVYDLVRDSIHIEGVSFIELGLIPTSYMMSIDDTGWYAPVPMPPEVLKSHFSKDQLKSFEIWSEPFKSTDDYSLVFLQTRTAY